MRPSLAQILVTPLLLALLAGCGARQRNADSVASAQAARPGVAPLPAQAEPSSPGLQPPKEIDRITDQMIVYVCPTCGRMYDADRPCPRDGSSMHPAKISYVCPYDGTLAFHRGACPRCGRPVKIEEAEMLPTGVRTQEVN